MAKVGTSQNGWTVYDDATFRDHSIAVDVKGIDAKMWAANDDVAVCLKDWAEWFHNNIEKLDMPVKEDPGYDDWSRALRAVRGQTTGYSNHASETAWDLNATLHPRGVKGTFTAAERNKMKAKLLTITDNDGHPVLRCGEFYSGTVDGMHIEVNASAARVKQAANKIRQRAKGEFDMATLADILEQMRKALTEPLIENKPTADEIAAAKAAGKPAPVGKKTSVAWFIQNVEQNQDDDRATNRAAFEAVHVRLESIEDSIQILMDRVSPAQPGA